MTRIDITLAGTAGLDLIVNCKIADWVRLLTPRFVLSDRAAKLDRTGADFDARRAERGREVRRGAATPECQLTWVMR